MTTATIVYHREDGAWWAESDDVPGFSALGNTFAEVRELVTDGLAFAGWSGDFVEFLEDGALVMPQSAAGFHALPALGFDYGPPASVSTPVVPSQYTTAHRALEHSAA